MCLTSTRDVIFDAKISTGASWIVTSGENDATHCFYFADHTGHCWGGHDTILANNQASNLFKKKKKKGPI